MLRLSALLALLLGACTHHPAATTPRAAPGAHVPAPAYYEAGGAVPRATKVERVWREPRSEYWRIEIPARVTPDTAEVPRVEDPIEIHYFRPRPAGRTPRPLVVMLPVLGNRMLLMREFGSGFVNQGYAVAVVPRKKLEFDVDRSIQIAEKELRVLIMRGRQAIDWLVRQPGIDPNRIGMFGLSAGGILGLALMGADPRIDAGVAVFAGAPMADVLVDTGEDKFAENAKAMQRERGWTKEQVRRVLRRTIRTDPLVLAPRIRREDVLLFIATDDESVPTRNQRLLWEALGRPEMHELQGGHYSGVALYLPHILSQAQGFLGRRLGAP